MFYEDARTVVALLAFVLDGSKPKIKPESIGWEQVFKIARQHSVAGMVCYGIEKLPLEKRPSAEIMKRFQQEKWKGIAKEAIQHISTEEILEALEAAKIRALPLKGYILKNSYPRPDMRVMADVDVLVDDANTKAVKELMLERGYSCENEGGNHDVYYRKPYMNVEVHRNILPEKHDLNGCFEGIFERTKKSGVYHYIKEMTPEDFYIYSLAHLKKHYAQGGTGIRSIMDLWVFKTDFRKKADWNVIEKELKKVGLYHFEEKLLHLAAVWFGVEEGDAEAQEIECFIFKNGTYGTTKNLSISSFAAAYDEKKSFKKHKRHLFIRTLFPDMHHMCLLFPWLENKKILLPVAWSMRAVRGIIKRPKLTLKRMQTVKQASEEEVKKVQDLYKKSGLGSEKEK